MKIAIATLGAWLCLAVSSHAVLIYADEWRVEYRLDIVNRRGVGPEIDPDSRTAILTAPVQGGEWRIRAYATGGDYPDIQIMAGTISGFGVYGIYNWGGARTYNIGRSGNESLIITPGMTWSEFDEVHGGHHPVLVTEGKDWPDGHAGPTPAKMRFSYDVDQSGNGYAIFALERYRPASASFAVPDGGSSTLPLSAVSLFGLTVLRLKSRR